MTTRVSDATVGLDDRAAQANAAKADVFLSIHCNASRAATAHGTEVYYLSLDASDRAAALLAESENATPATTPDTAEKNAAVRDLDLILWDLAQNQHLSASARLAEIVQADFNRLLGITTRGVKQAPFRVLIGVNAPAVLVEVAFITNPDEETRIGSDGVPASDGRNARGKPRHVLPHGGLRGARAVRAKGARQELGTAAACRAALPLRSSSCFSCFLRPFSSGAA